MPSHLSASNDLLGRLAKDHRFSDLAQISLLKAADCKDADCRDLWLRNSARASLKLGDHEGATYTLKLINAQTSPSLRHLKLSAYSAILSRDWTRYDLLLSKIGSFSKLEHAKTQALKHISGPKRNKPSTVAQVALSLQTYEGPQAEAYRTPILESPVMAGTLSAVLPGSGHASLGMWQSGFTSFFLVAVSVLTASEQYKNGNPMTGTAAALIGSVFYVGGIFSAATTAHEINDRRFKPARDEVRQWALPELQFEWTATNSPMSSRPDTAVRK